MSSFPLIAALALVTFASSSSKMCGAQDRAATVSATSPTAVKVAAARKSAKDGLTYVRIGPGTFEMGCTIEDGMCRDNEKPRRLVSLSEDFWIATTEVTVEAFRRFVADSTYETEAERKGSGSVLSQTGWKTRKGAQWRSPGFIQDGLHPVVLVSWSDANAFCQWSGGRMPTEAEWEYAARGGLEGTRYVWGTSPIPLVGGRKQANVADESASGVSTPPFESEYDDGAAYTSPVGAFEPNGFGLHDMAGNVLEWCADAADPDRRIARGGAWNNPPQFMRLSRRSIFSSGTALTILGIRCARDAAPPDDTVPREGRE